MKSNHLVKKVLMASVVGFALTTTARAAESGPWELGLNLGASIPTTKDNGDTDLQVMEFLKTSPRVEGSLLYQFREALAAGMEAGYSVGHKIEGEPEAFEPFTFTTDAHLHVFNLGPVIKIGSWINDGPVKPYLIAGANWSHLWAPDANLTVTHPTLGSLTVPVNEGDSVDYLGLSGGAGVQFKLSSSVVFGAEARYSRILAHGDDYEFIIPTARFAVLF